MKPLQVNPNNLTHAGKNKILQRADLTWSKMTIEPGEVLVVKVKPHMRDYLKDITQILDHVFPKNGDQILVFCEDDIELQKVIIK